MKEYNKAFLDSNGQPTATKTLTAGVSEYETRHINHGDLFNSDGNAIVGAKIDTSGLTFKVYCALKLGNEVGYSPWHELLDESDTRVSTFDSTKVFQASLYNQEWFNKNHLGFKLKFVLQSGTISGGEVLTCEVIVS